MTEAKKFERQIAKKIWIRELLEASLNEGNDTEATVIQTSRGAAGRVNVVGVIITRDEIPVPSITVDDGTGQVIVRSFERTIKPRIGAFVQVIGRPRDYQSLRYVAAETVTAIDPQWGEFRKRELGHVLEQKVKDPPKVETVQAEEETNAEKIIRLITQLDRGEGADIDGVIEQSKLKNAESIIEQLLMHGDVFELRPGKLKVL